MKKKYPPKVYTLEDIHKSVVARADIPARVSEDWPRWSYAGLEGHRKEYLKRNKEHVQSIANQLKKKGVSQDQIDEVIRRAESGEPYVKEE